MYAGGDAVIGLRGLHSEWPGSVACSNAGWRFCSRIGG